jgi:hypothetical protein
MIPKSGCRFSEKIMLKQKMSAGFDAAPLNQTLVPARTKTPAARAARVAIGRQ